MKNKTAKKLMMALLTGTLCVGMTMAAYAAPSGGRPMGQGGQMQGQPPQDGQMQGQPPQGERPELPEGVRTELKDYSGIPYQRGHICASADRLNSKEANEQTFYLSNIMPQTKALNEGIWQDMESKGQSWGRDDKFRRTLYVVKGGTIDDKNINSTTATGLVVPKYFFMALLCEDNDGGYHAMGFWVEHTAKNQKGEALSKFVVNINQLETLTGLDFFCNLPDHIENQVEASVSPKAWGFQ